MVELGIVVVRLAQEGAHLHDHGTRMTDTLKGTCKGHMKAYKGGMEHNNKKRDTLI